MGRIPSGVKVEKVCSRDTSRPVLAAPAIVEWQGGKALAATDSYKLVVFPLTAEEGDGLEVGGLSLELVREAVKDEHASIVSTGAGGVTELETFDGKRSARNVDGQFPAVEKLMPDQGANLEVFEIGLNARFLFDLAQSMGVDVVAVSFTNDTNGRPNPLRPMIVRPQAASAKRGVEVRRDARGLLMPVRTS